MSQWNREPERLSQNDSASFSLLCRPDGVSFLTSSMRTPGSGDRSLHLVSEYSETSLNQFQQQVFGAVSCPHHTLVSKNRLKDKYYITERCLWTVMNTKTCYLTTNYESSVSEVSVGATLYYPLPNNSDQKKVIFPRAQGTFSFSNSFILGP